MSKASSNAIQRIIHSLSPIMDVLYPPRCAGCQRSGHVLCSSCLARIHPLPMPICPRCGLPTPQAALCRECLHTQPAISALRAAGKYKEPLRACIRALKYDGNTRLAEPLGLLLARAYQRYGIAADALLPVPLHQERYAQRGYNHAALLAEACARHLTSPATNTCWCGTAPRSPRLDWVPASAGKTCRAPLHAPLRWPGERSPAKRS